MDGNWLYNGDNLDILREDVKDEPHHSTPSPSPARGDPRRTICRGSAARNTLEVVGSTLVERETQEAK